MHDINMQFSKDINGHLVLQEIIDYYFKETTRFYLRVGILNLAFNFFPFLLQIYEYGEEKNVQEVIVCNSLCIGVSIFTILIEFIVMF